MKKWPRYVRRKEGRKVIRGFESHPLRQKALNQKSYARDSVIYQQNDLQLSDQADMTPISCPFR